MDSFNKAHRISLLIYGIMLFSVVAAMPEAACAQEASPRHIYPATELVRAGEASAWVIYPSGPAGYREMAEKIVAAVKAKTGVEIKMLPDTEVTDAKHPVLLDPFRSRNLILLGRLGINRAIWGVYNHFLCAEDGYYPGGDGYVVRTASGVYTNGANTIIAGGSSDKGAARAVDKLVERIAGQPYKDGRLVLPWLLDVELGGECKKAFDNDEKRQMARAFPGSSQHEDNPSRRFYENIMSWYWSGRESYLKLGIKFLDHVLKEDNTLRSYHEHYATEFFVRAYNMIDDSGRLNAEQLRATDQAIIDTFNICYGQGPREPGYRSGLQRGDDIRPLDEVYTADHQNASWLADKVMADFIIDKIPETAKTAPIYKEARLRRAFYIKLFDALINERWRGCMGDAASTTVPAMSYFRYALEMERYKAFFDSGNARKAALYHLARVAPSGMDIGLQNRGLYAHTEFGIFVGIAASYYNDGELKQALDMNPGISMGHYGCYLLGVHTYRPGAEVPAVAPKSLTGATFIPLQPAQYRRIKSSLPYEKTFDFATIRSGFRSQDDYLLLSGGQDLPANAIVTLASRGRTCLAHTAEEKNFDQNALYISRLSKLNLETKTVPRLARLDHAASAPSASFISSTLPGYAGTDWNRQIAWIPGKFFVVFDKVTALEPDKYLVMANWRPNFYSVERRFGGLGPVTAGRLEGGRWIVRDDEQEFIIACAGNNIQPIKDAPASIPVYRQRLVADLKKGESASIANLMFARAVGSKIDYELRQTDEGGLLVRATDNQDNIYYIGVLPAALGKSDSPLVVISTNRLTAFDAGTLEVNGKVWANNELAKTREIDLGNDPARNTLKTLWEAGKISKPVITAAKDSKSSAKGVRAARWYDVILRKIYRKKAHKEGLFREWRYTGAKKPGLISGVKWIGSNTWDLGRVADLSQISAMLSEEFYYADQAKGWRGADSGNVHSQILISAEGTPGTFKPFRGEVVDIAVPLMQGYGKITKKEKVYQTMRGAPQKARYVKVVAGQTVSEHCYLFYDAGRPDEQGDLLRARVVAMRDKDKPDILVYPDIWPGFRSVTRLTHSIFAVDPGGHRLWGHEMKWRVFFVRALDWDGTGLKKIFAGSLDNNVYVYDGGGKLTQTLTVEGRLKDADGGYPLASGIGLWQPDKTGSRKPMLLRYCRVSFLGRDGSVEGDVNPGIYWLTDVLDYGVDYTGDGIEDSVAMAYSQIFTLTQGAKGAQADQYKLPYSLHGSLSGSPTLAFQLYGQGATILFVARQNMVALFDLKNRKWLMSWAPETSITAAVALPEHRQILCYTREGILWRIKLGADFAVSGVETAPVSTAFNRFTVLDRNQGAVVAASPAGLFRIGMDNSPVLLVPGSFVDADVYPSDTAAEKIIAVDKTGAVESYLLK